MSEDHKSGSFSDDSASLDKAISGNGSENPGVDNSPSDLINGGDEEAATSKVLTTPVFISENSESSLLASEEETSNFATPAATKEATKVPPSGDAEEASKVPPSGDAAETSKVPPSGDAEETSKVPPSGDAAETSKVPPSGDAEETSKVPPSGDAEETSKVNKAAEPAGTGASAVPTVNATSNPKPPPPAALLEANGGTHNAVAASTSGHIQRTDSCQGICAAADSSVTGGTLRKATTCPTDLSASAVSSGAVINQRPAGPPPVKVRRKEAPQQSAGDASADQQQPPPPRNYQFLAGDLEYFIVCGLPLSTTDQSLKRTFKGLFKKSLCDVSQVIIVPEIDSKTVLVFSGSGATPTAKVSKQLSLKRMQKKLQSSLFVSRFPEDANLNNMRAYASHSDEYLYKWTRLYFCPVSAQVAEEIQCQHFLVSNLSQSLLRSPSDLLIKFSQTMPTARSFFLPVDESESPLGYMLVRFNKSEDCLACYRLLQKHYSMEMTFVSLLEVCQLPGGFLVPAHNLLNWCRLEKPAASSASLSQPRIVLDDPVRSPYLCTCHPAAQTVAPPPEKLHILANELENAMGNPSAIVDFKSVLLRLC
ncbi:hypothetical protein BOX15_Mlig020161g3 [Macrostomum lignano]|uniref:RRM domain-containing protein n=1 Tax=Macrostomum lignano TaxID=282301 RepID=A0A267DFF8_9PLAT|nr:hypothetical protein BOX15_Mlig020161g3 [Macrostomum lignano]